MFFKLFYGQDDRLRVANVGDCRMMLIRKGSCINTTFEQQHSFNFPFQLGTGSKDKALDAVYDEFIIQEGDIVILGTDGVWDNVFVWFTLSCCDVSVISQPKYQDDEIIEMTRSIASKYSSPMTVDPQRIANALLKRAREVAEDARQMYSPFQEKAIQEGLYYQGGKMDDITVAVGIVLLAEDSPDRR